MLDIDPKKRPSVEDLIKNPKIKLRINERKMRDQYAKLKHKEQKLNKKSIDIKIRKETLEKRQSDLKAKEAMVLDLYNK